MPHLRLAINEAYEDGLKKHGVPFAKLDPAPKVFEEMWEARKQIEQELKRSQKHLDLPAGCSLSFAFA